MQEIKLTHVTSSVSRLAGGLLDCVRLLSKSLSQNEGVCQEVLGLEDEKTAIDLPQWNPIQVKPFRVIGPKSIGYAPKMFPTLCHSNPDIVHLHGLWKYPSVITSRWSHKTHRPYIVSPQGMLEPWALQRSRNKKKLAMLLFQRACLRNAACIHATAAMEVQSIRAAGFKNPVALIPNGVDLPPEEINGNREQSAALRAKSGTRTVLFLSRIHPKKGLLNLIEAWRQLAPPGWRLVIVGPDEIGHLSQVQHAVQKAGLEKCVEFPGEAWGDARWQFYRDADLFVLPTFSENFGIVIVEALACGVPVITTKGAPWEDLTLHKCGWWIEVGVNPLIQALNEAILLSNAQRQEMGQRGFSLVTAKYLWPGISQSMRSVYEWMQTGGAKPECVV